MAAIFLNFFEDNLLYAFTESHSFGLFSRVSDPQKHFTKYYLISAQQKWSSVCGSLNIIAAVFAKFQTLQSDHLLIIAASILLNADLFEYLARLDHKARPIPAYNKFAI